MLRYFRLALLTLSGYLGTIFFCCGVFSLHWRVFIKTSCFSVVPGVAVGENDFSLALSTPGHSRCVLYCDILKFLVSLLWLSFIVTLCVLVHHMGHFALSYAFP